MAFTSQKPSVMSTVLKKKKPIVYGSLISKSVDPTSQAKPDAVTQALKPQQRATLLPAQVPSIAPKSVLPKPAPVTKVAPTVTPVAKPQPAVFDQPNVARPNPNLGTVATAAIPTEEQTLQPLTDQESQLYQQLKSKTNLTAIEQQQLQLLEQRSQIQQPSAKPTAEQTAAGGGPPPDPTVPEVNQSQIDLPGKPVVPAGEAEAAPPSTLTAESVYGDVAQMQATRESLQQRINSLPQGSMQRNSLEGQLRGMPDYTQLIQYDNSVINSPPPSVQTDSDREQWNSLVKKEMDVFAGELKQYPDQFEKIFANHQKRMSGLAGEFESKGQYESQLRDLMNQAPPELKVKIEDLPSIQQNELYRKAIEQYGDNPSPDQLAAKYAEMFPNGYDFSLDQPGFTPDKGTLEDYQKEFNYDPTKSDAAINKTDTSGVNTSGQTQTGAQVTQAEIDALNKELGAQPLTEEEKNKILAGDFASIDADKQAAIKSAVSLGAASGWAKNLSAVVNATAGTAQRYDIEKAKMRGDLTRQNLAEVQARRSAAIQGLGGVATREAGIAGTQANAGLGAAEIESRENLAEGELQLAKDTLYQQGQLTSLGMQIEENLKAYGMKLDKYQTDQGFDLALMEKDLKERIANQTGDMQAAELQAKNITTSIQAGMEERRIDDSRAAEIANLEQRAAAGDVEAKHRTTQLRAETELRKLDLDNDWAQFVGQVLYNVMSGREQLDQRKAEFLESVRQYEESKGGGGFASILGSVAGTLAGSILPGVGNVVGGWLGNQVTGGGQQQPKVQS